MSSDRERFRARRRKKEALEERSTTAHPQPCEGALKYSTLPSPHITCTYANLAPASEELELVRTGALGGGGHGPEPGAREQREEIYELT